ncbi:DUF2634 domain-containing protein [Secundilactobacillus kimchicus]|uniref:DUF2634 domain-containing protein n=1 Tax=Secundilactobacillus kimchicus TaxID=528209 RepID=UPI001C02D096|nr:DUF2634 domain-containing protein [Secundilactobacillus kimchicus]MBT9670562.1 DUF2634 domain-containing protein [Secundilactobacillus kimchicus]
MATYVQHMISEPENLQMIATKELSDTTRWMEIAQLNHLKYPYIVKTAEEKQADPVHLATYGDVINLPVENRVNNLDYSTMDSDGKYRAYDMAMGMDLSLDFNWREGMDDDLMFMHANKDRDLAVTSGIANLKESIQKRLNTRYGSLMYHPKYGTHLLDLVGQKLNPSLVEDLKTEIIRTIQTDARVKSAEITYFVVPDGKSFFALVQVTPIDGEKAFEMFVEQAQGGNTRIG